MSWYSVIYAWVRNYRTTHKVRGWFLTRALNFLIVCQLFGLTVSYYVYVTCIAGHFITSPLQATIYLCIYTSLCVMALWCLCATIFTSIEHVPENYKVAKEADEALKAMTPEIKGRYVVDKSTPEQTLNQYNYLIKLCTQMNIVQGECDQAGRNKYCYVCSHLKPDRTHHCSSCGQCVVRFDHHCPWINHCVNYTNYKKFLLYVLYSTLTVVWFLLGTVECLIRFFVRQNWSDDAVPFVLILLVTAPFGLFGYYPLGELLIYHWGLISINETTCEQAKPAVLKGDWNADYNMGQYDNFEQVFGWGLWLFPFNTTTEDGMHFRIRYQNPVDVRYERIKEATGPNGEWNSETTMTSSKLEEPPQARKS